MAQDNSQAKRGGHYMDLLDHYFRPDGTSVCGKYGSRRGGDPKNALSKNKRAEAFQRGGGRPLCFKCEGIMLPKVE